MSFDGIGSDHTTLTCDLFVGSEVKIEPSKDSMSVLCINSIVEAWTQNSQSSGETLDGDHTLLLLQASSLRR
jgi:hypothetical protein